MIEVILAGVLIIFTIGPSVAVLFFVAYKPDVDKINMTIDEIYDMK